MLQDRDVEFVERGYGKHGVQLLHVRREGSVHYARELEVDTRLTLVDAHDYLYADNSSIIATDTQKNTVYILAKQNGISTIEQFGIELCQHFLKTYPQVVKVQIHIDETSWKRINQNGKEHVHAYLENKEAVRFCDVHQAKHGNPEVSAGLKDMKVLKTTQSAFTNFVRDKYTSLPEATDRIFCTVIYTKWSYATLQGLNYDQAWEKVKSSLLETFAGPPDRGVYSPSVQKTLYDAQKSALAKVPQISEIQIILPNVHAYQFDFSKYPALGITKNNEVFTPAAKPAGNIRATLKRRQMSKL